MKLKDSLRRLFCRHQWAKIAVFEDMDELRNIMYPIRRYKCLKCGRIVHQDGRHDRLAAKAVDP